MLVCEEFWHDYDLPITNTKSSKSIMPHIITDTALRGQAVGE